MAMLRKSEDRARSKKKKVEESFSLTMEVDPLREGRRRKKK
jgi:hypothetical protein